MPIYTAPYQMTNDAKKLQQQQGKVYQSAPLTPANTGASVYQGAAPQVNTVQSLQQQSQQMQPQMQPTQQPAPAPAPGQAPGGMSSGFAGASPTPPAPPPPMGTATGTWGGGGQATPPPPGTQGMPAASPTPGVPEDYASSQVDTRPEFQGAIEQWIASQFGGPRDTSEAEDLVRQQYDLAMGEAIADSYARAGGAGVGNIGSMAQASADLRGRGALAEEQAIRDIRSDARAEELARATAAAELGFGLRGLDQGDQSLSQGWAGIGLQDESMQDQRDRFKAYMDFLEAQFNDEDLMGEGDMPPGHESTAAEAGWNGDWEEADQSAYNPVQQAVMAGMAKTPEWALEAGFRPSGETYKAFGAVYEVWTDQHGGRHFVGPIQEGSQEDAPLPYGE